MLIIKIEARDSGQHLLQSQSHRTECWLDGWVAVAEEREREIMGCRGYGDLIAEDGKFVDFTPNPELIPTPEEAESASEGATWDEMAAAIGEGVNEV